MPNPRLRHRIKSARRHTRELLAECARNRDLLAALDNDNRRLRANEKVLTGRLDIARREVAEAQRMTGPIIRAIESVIAERAKTGRGALARYVRERIKAAK